MKVLTAKSTTVAMRGSEDMKTKPTHAYDTEKGTYTKIPRKKDEGVCPRALRTLTVKNQHELRHLRHDVPICAGCCAQEVSPSCLQNKLVGCSQKGCLSVFQDICKAAAALFAQSGKGDQPATTMNGPEPPAVQSISQDF